jgi:DNA-binding NarL/FixJ family response regulator
MRTTGALASGKRAWNVEQLLVYRGWHCLRREIRGSTLQVALCLGRREDADRLHLTPREFQVCGLAARGLATKHIAAELSITPATARGTLSRALRKLQLRNRAQVPALWHAINTPGKRFELDSDEVVLVFECEIAPCESIRLTWAERAVLVRMLRGDTNHAISRERGTTARTVAKQVSVILRKFAVSSRNELSVKVLERQTDRAGTA